MKKRLLPLLALLVGSTAHAATTQSFTFTPGLAIPDGDPGGLVNVQNPGFVIGEITGISVALDIGGAPAGGFNGDLYVQLTHAGGLSVLLNRPGRTSNTGLGSVGHMDGGLNFVFNDAASVNAHDYVSPGTMFAPVAGTFQPDARTTDPSLVLASDPIDPTATLLGAFGGLTAAGDWNLLLVDNQVGTGDMVLNAWTLTVVGNVPEPGTMGLYVVFLGALPWIRRWRMRSTCTLDGEQS